jgi:hypothetical protein
MPIDRGAVTLNGFAEERTFRTIIDTAGDKVGDYTITCHREIVVRDTKGVVIRRIRQATDEFPDYKPRIIFKALEAEAVTPGIVASIRDTLDTLASNR